MGEVVKVEGTNPDGRTVTLDKSQPEQLSLFQHFLPSDPRFSNTIDLFDAIPKYYSSPKQMDRLRQGGKYLEILERSFTHRNPLTGDRENYRVEIRPARLKTTVKGENGKAITVEKEFYPTAREEIVEEALRKLATSGENGVFLDGQVGVQFTLYQLKKELAERGHSITLASLKESLAVAHYSKITVATDDEVEVMSASIFPVLLVSTRKQWLKNPKDARYYVQFNPLVTQSLNRITYRQYDYATFMACERHLTRWLHKRLSHNYVQADWLSPYTIKASTIIANSGLVNNARLRDRIKAVDDAVEELKKRDTISVSEKEPLYGSNGRTLVDAKYTLTPTGTFIDDVKAANHRKKLLHKQAADQ